MLKLSHPDYIFFYCVLFPFVVTKNNFCFPSLLVTFI